MTIDEAIFDLGEIQTDLAEQFDADDILSLQLGIEALKRVQAYKQAHVGLHYEPMPGETKD